MGDLLNDDPRKEQALRDFLGYLASLGVTPAPTPAAQFQYAERGATNIGRDYIHNGDNVGRDKVTNITKKKTQFILPPVLFGHAVKAVTAHWVVSTVTVVVVVGGASAGLALAPKGANAPVSPPTASAVPAPPSGAVWGAMQGGPARTGNQPAETRIGAANVSKLTQVRTYKSNSEVGQSTAPLAANGVLYVATNELYAFAATGSTNCSAAPTTCTPLWTAPVAYVHNMTITDGRVFVTDAEGVRAFDAAGSENCSGTPKVCAPLWATSTNASTGPGFTPGPGSPVVVNGVLFAGSGTIYAYSL